MLTRIRRFWCNWKHPVSRLRIERRGCVHGFVCECGVFWPWRAR